MRRQARVADAFTATAAVGPRIRNFLPNVASSFFSSVTMKRYVFLNLRTDGCNFEPTKVQVAIDDSSAAGFSGLWTAHWDSAASRAAARSLSEV